MNKDRIQLTLFIDENEAEEIEKIRKRFNPEQYKLIKSHVTLCREDELEEIEKVLLNLENIDIGHITIDFGGPVRFSNGKGVLIPTVGRNEQFQRLRAKVLHGIIGKPGIQEPHITLMHPRNSTCTDEIFKQIEKNSFPDKIKFKKIALIEQEIGLRWCVLKEVELNGRS